MIFEPKTYQASATVGACMAGLAISDSVTILHGGAGCDIKLHSLLNRHNLSGDVHHRIVSTKISEHELILNPEEVLLKYAKDIVNRTGAKIVLITAASFVEVSGIDFDYITSVLEKKLHLKVIYVKAPDFSGDLFYGYEQAILRFIEKIVDFDTNYQPQSDKINIIGYFFDRPEYEHYGNFVEMRRYLKALNLNLNSIFFDGGSLKKLKLAGKAKFNIVFPLGKKSAQIFEKKFDQISVYVDLPMGIKGTNEWILKIGEKTGRTKAAKSLINQEQSRVLALIRRTFNKITGKRIVIFSDSYKIKGLLNIAKDLKLNPVVIGILDDREVRLDQENLKDNTLVMNSPSINEVFETLRKKKEKIDLVIGTSVEIELAKRLNIRGLEFGFPANSYHVLYPAPYFGYSGVLILGSRIMEVLS